jgi:PAS domain-containing protein
MVHLEQVFWVNDATGKTILYISPAYEKIWGRTRQGLYDNSHALVDSIHPQDRDRVAAAIARKPEVGGYDEEFRIIRPDGRSGGSGPEATPFATSRAGRRVSRALPKTSPNEKLPRPKAYDWPRSSNTPTRSS